MNDRIVVIAGGLSPERDVSLRSGRRVAEDLRDAGFQAEVRDIDATLLADLQNDPPACAFPIVHGVAGEDGSLQEVLQAINIPFVGSDATSCRRSFDKAIAAGQTPSISFIAFSGFFAMAFSSRQWACVS